MKTNYAEQLAWFEYAVKPYVVTQRRDNGTRCWHSTQQRAPVDYDRFRESSVYNREGSSNFKLLYSKTQD